MTAAHHDTHVAPSPPLRLVPGPTPAAPVSPEDTTTAPPAHGGHAVPGGPGVSGVSGVPAVPAAVVEVGPDKTLPRLRLRALPQPEPAAWSPEQPQRHGPGPGGRQLSLVLPGVPRTVLQPTDEGPVPTPSSELPCPDALARSLVQAAVDVVRGHRPASQVLRWTTPEVYSQLRQRARLEQARERTGGRRPVVRSLRTAPAGPRGTEVSAVVLDGPRARAVAARLDGEDGRWRLTALVIG